MDACTITYRNHLEVGPKSDNDPTDWKVLNQARVFILRCVEKLDDIILSIFVNSMNYPLQFSSNLALVGWESDFFWIAKKKNLVAFANVKLKVLNFNSANVCSWIFFLFIKNRCTLFNLKFVTNFDQRPTMRELCFRLPSLTRIWWRGQSISSVDRSFQSAYPIVFVSDMDIWNCIFFVCFFCPAGGSVWAEEMSK